MTTKSKEQSGAAPVTEQGATWFSALEQILIWEGEITNQRIRDLLQVKPVYASILITSLMRFMGARAGRDTARAPLRMRYKGAKDKNKRTPDAYLETIKGLPGASQNPSLYAGVIDTRLDLSLVEPAVFSMILQAIEAKTGLVIEYRSMSTPKGKTRLVFPHALVRAPRRWHMRSWCNEAEDFRDFTLSRITSAERADQANERAFRERDASWVKVIDLKLIPHPKLTLEQQEMIAAENFPGASSMRIKCRECLAPYILQDLRVATDLSKHQPPEYQLALFNAKDLRLGF